ncbi:MAG: DNA topoisomerase VI subunit B [Candidatus Aenigmatarchaeota archaeon]
MPGKTAEEMALDQREISVAEFFEKNRHLLGFDNPAKALITVVKEAVDNSLDACEEAGKLPKLDIEIEDLEKNKYKIKLKDNGPGIVKEQMPSIFGKLLYGSKFHKLQQSRGQQGIGISASVLYAQLTTGKPAIITSKTDEDSPAKQFKLKIDTMKNEPEIISEEVLDDDFEPGTEIDLVVEGKYLQRYHSVDEYLRQTAIANPYCEIHYKNPEGEEYHFERGANHLPPQPKEIKPHPYGVELGVLVRMLKNTDSNRVSSFLRNEFTKIGRTSAEEICRLADVEADAKPKNLKHKDQENLLEAMQKVKIQRPPTNCLSPIGEDLVKRGLEKEIDAEFVTSTTRDPEVYRGNPFQVEVGIAYGGELMEEENSTVDVMRYANKVPLLYQASSCAITKALEGTDWKRYGLEQPGSSGTPKGPAVIFVHLCSTWVPFTSESKESIARYPKIVKEIKLALQECARRLRTHISKKERGKKEKRREKIFSNYLPLVLENAVELAEEGEELSIDPVMKEVIDKELVKKAEKSKTEEIEEDEDGE